MQGNHNGLEQVDRYQRVLESGGAINILSPTPLELTRVMSWAP